MRTIVNAWSDVGDDFWLHPPNQLVRSADRDYEKIITEADSMASTGRMRHVRYTPDGGTTYYELALVPFVMPAGASTITFGTLAAQADGIKQTYTPVLQGRFISELGVLGASGATARSQAGILFDDYYTSFTDNLIEQELGRALTLAEGDFCWVIREGYVDVWTASAVTALDNMMMDAGGLGKVSTSTAVNTGGTIAQYNASLIPNTLGTGRPGGACLGYFTASRADAGLVRARVMLPPRYSHTN